MAKVNDVGGDVEPMEPLADWVQVVVPRVCWTLPDKLVPLAVMVNTRVWSPWSLLLQLDPVQVPLIQLVLVGVAVAVAVGVAVAVAVGAVVAVAVGVADEPLPPPLWQAATAAKDKAASKIRIILRIGLPLLQVFLTGTPWWGRTRMLISHD